MNSSPAGYMRSTSLDLLVNQPTSLSPLPSELRRGLTAVSVLGLTSFFLSLGLFTRLCYRILCGRRLHKNQFFILILNLILADIQQSIAFLLNTQWLVWDSITVETTACWAQGWFVSTGDLASGVFTLAIALHTFIDIVFGYRLSQRTFLTSVALLWTFVYTCAIIGVALHPRDIYVRAGAWCWVNDKYANERLYLHYLWILVAEFGSVLVYGLMYIILRRRLATSYYPSSDTAKRARSTANAIIVYPIIYVVCTLPLASARIAGMTGRRVSFIHLCIAGAMITSNGWLDVALYSVTRRALIFSSSTPEDMRAIDTFVWRPDGYGTTTTIEAIPRPSSHRRAQSRSRFGSKYGMENTSTEELVDMPQGMVVQTKTEVLVRTDGLAMEQLRVRGRDDSDQKSSLSKTSLAKDLDDF